MHYNYEEDKYQLFTISPKNPKNLATDEQFHGWAVNKAFLFRAYLKRGPRGSFRGQARNFLIMHDHGPRQVWSKSREISSGWLKRDALQGAIKSDVKNV